MDKGTQRLMGRDKLLVKGGVTKTFFSRGNPSHCLSFFYGTCGDWIVSWVGLISLGIQWWGRENRGFQAQVWIILTLEKTMIIF